MEKTLNIIKLGKCSYKKALEVQYEILEKRQNGEIGDTLILVEHPPVITAGKNASKANILVSQEYLKQNGVELFEINRGGDVTYHGDGQIVGYPIISLNDNKLGVKAYVEKLEQVFIDLLKEKYNIETKIYPDHIGVFVGIEKITAIGIAVKRGVTMHGFAFNVNTFLDHFRLIIPCGLTDMGVTSIEKITGEKVDFEETNEFVLTYFCRVFGYNDFKIVQVGVR